MSSKESMNRAHRIKAEQEQLVAALSDDDLFKQLWRKVLDVFTHKAKPSTMSIPVDHERDDDCYVALRLNQLRDRLRAASTECSRKDDVIAHLDSELTRADSRLKTILDWCEGNIESRSQVAPFCVQVRDLIETDTPSGRESS